MTRHIVIIGGGPGYPGESDILGGHKRDRVDLTGLDPLFANKEFLDPLAEGILQLDVKSQAQKTLQVAAHLGIGIAGKGVFQCSSK